MIFKETHRYVLDSTKTQTRRLVKPGDIAFAQPGAAGSFYPTALVTDARNRLRWEVGKDYAVQSGRGKSSLGRIRLIAIRKEQLQEISAEDCTSEGLVTYHREHAAVSDLRQQFEMLWDGIHTLNGQRWDDNPEVWVLEFELAR
ncbi:hypothetical protein LCGC14_0401260 [marine sediment metagenome]|uniref:ASCH domain-containing protein n=1 Tax=marine sediment metagenome TaxID=412755 RepID=A0A0F9W5Y0_9ZZZZ